MAEYAERPWGSYTVIAEADSFKVKTIEVRPGQRLSYQTHSRRSEHWFVVTGHGVVTLDGGTGTDQRDEVGCVDGPPPGLC